MNFPLCVCIHVFQCECTCVCLHTCASVWVHLCVSMSALVCVCIHALQYEGASMCLHTRAEVWVHLCAYAYMCFSMSAQCVSISTSVCVYIRLLQYECASMCLHTCAEVWVHLCEFAWMHLWPHLYSPQTGQDSILPWHACCHRSSSRVLLPWWEPLTAATTPTLTLLPTATRVAFPVNQSRRTRAGARTLVCAMLCRSCTTSNSSRPHPFMRKLCGWEHFSVWAEPFCPQLNCSAQKRKQV